MAAYGGATPKRHVAWSNSEHVGLLDLGKLVFNFQGDQYQKHKTSKTYVDAQGKKRFQGNKQQLKQSQILGLQP